MPSVSVVELTLPVDARKDVIECMLHYIYTDDFAMPENNADINFVFEMICETAFPMLMLGGMDHDGSAPCSPIVCPLRPRSPGCFGRLCSGLNTSLHPHDSQCLRTYTQHHA